VSDASIVSVPPARLLASMPSPVLPLTGPVVVITRSPAPRPIALMPCSPPLTAAEEMVRAPVPVSFFA